MQSERFMVAKLSKALTKQLKNGGTTKTAVVMSGGFSRWPRLASMADMKTQIWEENYKITSYLVNLRGKAGLYAMLNLIQDVGWMHAIHSGVRLGKNYGWVFTRQKLVMNEWPAWNQNIVIRTWLRPPEGEAFFLRDYEILRDGKKIGECTSTFTVMDMQTRKMATGLDWSAYSELWNPAGHLVHKPVKIPYTAEAKDLICFEVRNSDIDLNHHVNNTKYAQWVLDSVSLDTLRGQSVEMLSYEVNFLAEAKPGDQVQVQQATEAKPTENGSVIQFQGVRVSDKKPVFTVLMTIRGQV